MVFNHTPRFVELLVAFRVHIVMPLLCTEHCDSRIYKAVTYTHTLLIANHLPFTTIYQMRIFHMTAQISWSKESSHVSHIHAPRITSSQTRSHALNCFGSARIPLKRNHRFWSICKPWNWTIKWIEICPASMSPARARAVQLPSNAVIQHHKPHRGEDPIVYKHGHNRLRAPSPNFRQPRSIKGCQICLSKQRNLCLESAYRKLPAYVNLSSAWQ